jgi:peptidoglycan/LPS O-acetylase OafA/YrhL
MFYRPVGDDPVASLPPPPRKAADPTPAKDRKTYSYLNLARGLAALAVFGNHLRAFVFTDYAPQTVGLGWKVFYFVTGFGHEAVVIFFVLSGFLIGMNVAESIAAQRWSWTDYAVKRLSRLWIVLIPALILTAIFDGLGREFFSSAFYSGALIDMYHSGPYPANSAEFFTLKTFVFNVFFLQTIAAPTFGTNGPLWSLANEFWYYAIFPMLLLAFRSKNAISRLLYGAAALLLCWLLDSLLVGGVIWLMGYGVWLVSGRATFPTAAVKYLLLGVALFVFAGVLSLVRLSLIPTYGDVVIGIAFAVLLVPLIHLEISNVAIRRAAKWLANMSYTLYLTHFPIAAFLANVLLHNERFVPGLAGSATFLGLFCVIMMYSYAVYLLFERHTSTVQRELLFAVASESN